MLATAQTNYSVFKAIFLCDKQVGSDNWRLSCHGDKPTPGSDLTLFSDSTISSSKRN